jgi:geranylgeranyl reductase family protein
MDAVDIAVVGAGPAGAWAAERLARSGARVTIFDPSHPREKPCGGGVTGRALSLVSGSVDLAAVPSTAVRAARFLGRDGASATVPLEPGALVVASRATFDATILAAAVRAGAVHERTRVRDVALDADGVRIATDAGPRRAGFVIGADGANSLVRRRLARAFRRDQLSTATGVFARGATSDEIVIEFDANPPGYFWSFPRPDHLAIGVCAPADAGVSAGALRDRAAVWAKRAVLGCSLPRRSSPEVASEGGLTPYSWPIPTLDAGDFDDAGSIVTGGSRWALAGDAAGLVDPITREGIYFAIASGGWIADALARGEAERYRDRVQDEAIAELARAARMKPFFYRGVFTGLLVSALQQSAAIRAVMADLVAGRQRYAGLKWRLLGTWELGLAARALRLRAG